jgi:tetratricopeptide (TPR) repeat protein
VEDTGEHDIEVESQWPEDVYLPPRRRRLGIWIVGLFLVPSFALLGWVAEKRYHLVALMQHRGVPQASVDSRVESFLAEGERALSDGNLELAQGDFDKASVLTDRDARVLLDEARVAAAKADVPWLKLRLLLPHANEEARVASAELRERVAVAGQTADDAVAAAPQDPRAMRAKLDALRLAGDSQGARGYVVAVFAQASEAETAYVLAALDLGQPASPWATVVERLRLATGTEGGSGRARAALIYALAKAGDLAGAKTELAKLDAQARLYPLLPDLHAWMGLEPAVTPASPAAEAPAPAAAPSAADSSAPPQPPTPSGAATATPGEPGRPSSPSTLQSAAQAMSRGEYDRAERIYQGILAMDPNDSQALAGLGDVRRLHGDPWGAIDAYQSAIKINPSYLPALLGLADTQWGRGDKVGAARSYKHIVDSFPDGMYPDYVNQRIAP